MSEKEFKSRMRKIQIKNKSKERKEKLKAEKSKYKQKLNIETHKLLAIYLFVVFNIVLVYAMKAMWEFRDLSSLGLLITDILGQVLIFAIYCLKAYKGKKQEELMKFEKEKLFGVSDLESIDDTDDADDSDSDEFIG